VLKNTTDKNKILKYVSRTYRKAEENREMEKKKPNRINHSM
jgi:hypothetical protein